MTYSLIMATNIQTFSENKEGTSKILHYEHVIHISSMFS